MTHYYYYISHFPRGWEIFEKFPRYGISIQYGSPSVQIALNWFCNTFCLFCLLCSRDPITKFQSLTPLLLLCYLVTHVWCQKMIVANPSFKMANSCTIFTWHLSAAAVFLAPWWNTYDNKRVFTSVKLWKFSYSIPVTTDIWWKRTEESLIQFEEPFINTISSYLIVTPKAKLYMKWKERVRHFRYFETL